MSASFPATAIPPLDQRIAVDINTVNALVWDEYRTEKLSQRPQEQGATWQFMCLWEDRFAIARALVGGGYVSGQEGTVYINGWAYPDNPYWLVHDLTIKPYAPYMQTLSQPGTVIADYPVARFNVNFTVPEFQIGQPQNTGEDEIDFCSNAVPTTGSATNFVWSDGTAVPADMSPPITYTTMKYTKSLYNRSRLNIQLFQSLLNNVNSGAFMGSPAGTVLFLGARSSRKYNANGPLNWDIQLHFEINGTTGFGGTTSGWNKLFRPPNPVKGIQGGWTNFTCAPPNNQPLFPMGDLNALLA